MREIGHSLALAFDTPGADFVRGVELGRLWERLKSDEPVVEQMHASNAEMLLRIADSTGRQLKTETLDDTWLLVHFDAPV
ncbi:MAG: hypothetical protein ABSG93_17240 [Solirubrobacteraceae bacterium]|jgi:hypothetical protein